MSSKEAAKFAKAPVRVGADRKAAPERRGKSLMFAGNAMAVFIAVVFVATYVVRSWQYDFWGYSFYKDAVRIETGCEYAYQVTDTPAYPAALDGQPRAPISLPHPPYFFAGNQITGKYTHVVYHCQIPQSADVVANEVPYLHFGWIMTDRAEVYVNGSKRLTFNGEENLSLALNSDEFVASDLDVVIKASGLSRRRFGLAGTMPVAIATKQATNYKIRGLQMAFQNITPLYATLPLLTLAIVLVFAWFLGLRSRLIVVTFFYFSLNLIFNALILFGDLLPWGVGKSYFLSRPFQISAWLAILLIGLELLQWRNRKIFALGIAIVVAAVIETAVIALMEFPQSFIQPLWQSYRVFGALAGIGLLVVAVRKMPAVSDNERNIYRAFGILIAIYSTMLFADFVITATDMAIQIGHYMELLLPLFISGLLFYSLAQIEKRMVIERERRQQMENDLSLAAKLQGILLPEALAGEALGLHYEIDSKPLGLLGGDWAKIHASDGRALFLLGDVVGKGSAAALTHSGIAAAWESFIKQWTAGRVTTEELLMLINTTMFNLFRGSMNSTFTALEVVDQRFRVACAGNHWVHLSPTKSSSVGVQTRALLGVKAELEVVFQEVVLAEGDWLVTFTDGVLDGSRPLKRFMRAVQSRVTDLTGQEIREQLALAGADETHPDDASSLVLRYLVSTRQAA